MKKILFFSVLSVLVYSQFNASAQLKVKQDGTVLIFGEITGDNYAGEVSSSVYGDYGASLANGRLAIGDYGSMANHGGNIFIGEYGTNVDSDVLQVHGKLGMYFTRDYGEVVAYYKYSEGNKFNFNCDVYANSFHQISDERLKDNINKLNKTLPLLRKLEGVSYNLRPNIENEKFQEAAGGSMTEKEKQSQMEYKKAKEKYQSALAKKKRLGFIAQDVKKIFPELVEQDSAGYLSIDYIGIIPVLVEAVKEQQEIIDGLLERVETIENDCCNKNENLKSGSIDNNGLDLEGNKAKLYQNNPNPFSTETTVKFEIPQSVQSAQLHICNMVGTLLKTIAINQPGTGNVIISGNEFTPGMYLYSLVCDGVIIDTKQMLLTN
ncbi:MAG: tail fiber domain-containing protein [Draconibacterium sp.]|nr:tail fiber domain-containing protein [Draconibacterium sp.]